MASGYKIVISGNCHYGYSNISGHSTCEWALVFYILKYYLRDLWLGVVVFLFIIGYLTLPQYHTEQHLSGESPKDTIQGRLSLEERLGYAALIESGYGTVQYVKNEDIDKSIENHEGNPFRVTVLNERFTCIMVPVLTHTFSNFRELVESILVVETSARDGFRRAVEFKIGKVWLRLFGSAPNFTYGVGQIRLSVAKRIFANIVDRHLSDIQMLELLEDPCENINIASQYIAEITDKVLSTKNLKDPIGNIASIYAGIVNEASDNFFYVASVRGVFELLGGHYPRNEVAEEEKPEELNAYLCVGFNRYSYVPIEFRAEVTAGVESEKIDKVDPNKDKGARIQFYPGDEKIFRDFSDTLATARKRALLDVAVRMGFEPHQVEFREGTSMAPECSWMALGAVVRFEQFKVPMPDPERDQEIKPEPSSD